MKVRIGFVSNSSSTSFCIIGTSNWAKTLFDADPKIKKVRCCEHPSESNKKFCGECGEPMWKLDDDDAQFGYGMHSGATFNYYGNCTEDVHYAGLDAEKLLEKMTIPEAKKHFVKLVKEKLKLDIPEKQVGFFVDTCGEG